MTEDGQEYPEGLTPGERRVLDYVRLGTLDAETAVRLGIPLGDVKDRVNRIVTKLGLRDRSELVNPRRAPAATAAEAPASWARPAAPEEFVIDFTGASSGAPEEAVIDFSDLISGGSGQ